MADFAYQCVYAADDFAGKLSNERFEELNPFNYESDIKLATCQTAGCFCNKSTSNTCRTYAYLNTVYCFCAEEAATKAAY